MTEEISNGEPMYHGAMRRIHMRGWRDAARGASPHDVMWFSMLPGEYVRVMYLRGYANGLRALKDEKAQCSMIYDDDARYLTPPKT